VEHRRGQGLAAVAVLGLLITQLLLATAILAEDRPARYGWQMYSAVPYSPKAWAVSDGAREAIDAEALMVHGRAEIDRVELLRTVGCDHHDADSIVIELADGSINEVVCP
jgi:hypothetical protein